MDGRPLLKDTKKVRALLDSKTFDELLGREDRLAIAMLRHCDSDYLEFVRTPLETANSELKKVVEYTLRVKNSEIKSVEIELSEGSWEKRGFDYQMKYIESITKTIYQTDKIGQSELDRIMPVFVQAIFNRSEKSNIYITNGKILLKNRLWFESRFPRGLLLNIMSVEEASIFLDLFFKKNGNYYSSCRHSLNKGLWYWLSMRLKIPHYNVGDLIVDALAYRLYFALMALDEIGIQFYSGVNNDTMDNTLYHFNYLISLITGIFDNLALKTNYYLGINFSDLRKVSLSNKSGREFLKKVRNKNRSIRNHISFYANFIQLVYLFRELVIHREGLGTTSFEYKNRDMEWKANFIIISKGMWDYIKACGGINNDFDQFTKWGVYKSHGKIFLEPFHLSINVMTMLIKFVDKYLELFGYPSFIENQKRKEDDFTRILTFFEKYHLGF